MDTFKEIPAINFYGRSNVESNIQHAVEKDIGDVDAPKRSRTRHVYYAEESDSDENDPFHDNDDDRDGCYIPEIDCSDEELENEVEVAIEIDEEDDVEDALNDLGSGVEYLSVECDAVIDEATETPIDRRPRLREFIEVFIPAPMVTQLTFPVQDIGVPACFSLANARKYPYIFGRIEPYLSAYGPYIGFDEDHGFRHFKKQRYNSEAPRDAEELSYYLEKLSSDDEDYDNIENCNKLQCVLFPPKDGADSNIDDAPSDGEEMCSLRDIGKGILRQPMEVVSVSKTNDKNEILSDEENTNFMEHYKKKLRI
ncbi:hypothetical protein FQA39_LY05349 [Lamprigera yunnana]|nr:hypothetical protein FQA39_LY05349 [Lamprigera yunnana]